MLKEEEKETTIIDLDNDEISWFGDNWVRLFKESTVKNKSMVSQLKEGINCLMRICGIKKNLHTPSLKNSYDFDKQSIGCIVLTTIIENKKIMEEFKPDILDYCCCKLEINAEVFDKYQLKCRMVEEFSLITRNVYIQTSSLIHMAYLNDSPLVMLWLSRQGVDLSSKHLCDETYHVYVGNKGNNEDNEYGWVEIDPLRHTEFYNFKELLESDLVIKEESSNDTLDCASYLYCIDLAQKALEDGADESFAAHFLTAFNINATWLMKHITQMVKNLKFKEQKIFNISTLATKNFVELAENFMRCCKMTKKDKLLQEFTDEIYSHMLALDRKNNKGYKKLFGKLVKHSPEAKKHQERWPLTPKNQEQEAKQKAMNFFF